MSKIIELPEVLANQIAAGEVVERPASVVKELIENAIDAGATRISVEVLDAGLQKIVVTDDGEGIAADDVPRALLRHATSKITASTDLFRIRTLGFRGEALPSIASVSAFAIETATADENAGTTLIARGGQIESVSASALRTGTKITVENLFYNTPARLKYVKSLQSELAHIVDVLNRAILAHPEISFRLTADGRDTLHSAGSGDLRQAIAGVYGLETARKMRPIQAADLDFEISGYVALPELTRASRNYITLLVNGRPIKNFLLQKAIAEGYGSKLMVGRFPVAVVAIRVAPQLTDVNVHPSKQEIRLSKEAELRALIVSAIQEMLSGETLIPSAVKEVTEPTPADEIFNPKKQVQEELFVAEETVSYAVSAVSDSVSADRTPPDNSFVSETTNKQKTANQTFPELQFLAQLHRTYLLCEAPDGLYIVDQHAAAERINLEHYRTAIGNVSFDQQMLLTPLIIDLPKNDFIRLSTELSQLLEAGVELAPYGESQFILRAHPVWMREGEIESATYALIDLILAGEAASVVSYRKELAILISCKAAIKANMPLDPDSARDLLRQLSACADPYHCAHGRPAIVKFETKDLEKMFRRIMQTHLSARENGLFPS
ncbi:MAG: DNA mismatch repair endonuclease MutL [Streptococcaceae bacterium]|jgi:DNA mismatch repair protein MutL|nr:DNA mismatch repair endonuclease MutL [Streptococcaceae bacterium]